MSTNPDKFEEADGAALETEADRRRHPRIAHHAVFNLRPAAPGKTGANAAVSVVLQDLSITGMGIIHSDALPMGGQYQIPLTREGSVESLALVATVVRCEQLDDGLYSIGFQFNSLVNTSTMASEISSQQQQSPKR
jgi:c-di-GMP-binding flagellar brake protein YcgR